MISDRVSTSTRIAFSLPVINLMKYFVILAWLCLCPTVFAAPKFAIVRVTDIYRDLPSTKAMQERIQKDRESIMLNKRAEQLRIIIGQLQAQQAKLEENKEQLESENGKKMIRAYEIKRQEAETLREEFEQFRAEEEKRINREMVAAMRASLDRITAAANQLAKERNLDVVMDTSGNTNTGVPFVLFQNDQPDITEDVIEFLDETAIDATPPETSPEESIPEKPKEN